MTTRYFATALLATLFAAAAVKAQSSPADLLQKGIYAQETLGDLDGAIQIYRQVTSSVTAPKPLAAQAQYQLVLCMLQKGDRASATHELDLPTRSFPDQQDYINKARKLIPGASTLLAPPWADGEASQLNIKRDGVFTGEYLYYSATPWRSTVREEARDPARSRDAVANAPVIFLGWKLLTKTSTRRALARVDGDTMRHLDQMNVPNPSLDSNDVLGDASAAPFAGPAIDAEPLVFRMRVLPLAVGYKTTLTTLPFLLGYGVPRPVELAVTGVEPVQTVAGKFNCYRVTFAALGQTFWIGVDGSRPLVKFQSGNVEAELVKMWGPSVFEDAVAFFKTAGWTVMYVTIANDGLTGSALACSQYENNSCRNSTDISMQRIYTPPAELDQAVQQACSDQVRELETQNFTEVRIHPQSVQTRMLGGYKSVSCLIDHRDKGDHKREMTDFCTWIYTGSLILRFSPGYNSDNRAVYRWAFDPVINTFKLP